MPKIKDLVVKVGEYQKNGEKKNRYQTVGSIIEKDDGGTYMLLSRTFNPAGVPFKDGSDMITVSMYDPKDGGEATPAPRAETPRPMTKAVQLPVPPDFDDDIPF